MPTHSTTIRYISSPEGYRTTLPIDILANGDLTPNTDIGLQYEHDLNGLALLLTSNTETTCATRALSYEGENKQNAILTFPKQFVRMFGLSGAPIMVFPAHGGLICQIDHRREIEPRILTTPLGESTLSKYKSGDYAIRIPETALTDSPSLHDTIGDSLYVSMATTKSGALVICVECNEENASPDSIQVKANPSMVYKQDTEAAFLFPIPVGDILFPSEPELTWHREGTQLYAEVTFTDE